MRRLLRFLGQIIAAVFVILIFSVIWIIFDGLTDLGDKADVALVFDDPSSKAGTDALLDRVVERFKDGDFTAVIVSSDAKGGKGQNTLEMTKYLADHGLPATIVTQAKWDETDPGMPEHITQTVKSHHFNSVLLITKYYQVTLTKLELAHAGVPNVLKGHVGTLQKEDAWKIANEVVVLYGFLGKTYFLPAADKVKEEAKVGAEKAKEDAAAARDTVSKGLNSLPQ